MSRLLPRYYRRQLEAEDKAKIAAILVESGEAVETHAPATAPGDPLRLRGLPVVGVGGAIPGTNPLQVLLRKNRA